MQPRSLYLLSLLVASTIVFAGLIVANKVLEERSSKAKTATESVAFIGRLQDESRAGRAQAKAQQSERPSNLDWSDLDWKVVSVETELEQTEPEVVTVEPLPSEGLIISPYSPGSANPAFEPYSADASKVVGVRGQLTANIHMRLDIDTRLIDETAQVLQLNPNQFEKYRVYPTKPVKPWEAVPPGLDRFQMLTPYRPGSSRLVVEPYTPELSEIIGIQGQPQRSIGTLRGRVTVDGQTQY